jgi:arabinogalactan endo-1,4-beta-galactosidase
MILGIDVSTYLEELEHGAKYYANGVEVDPLDLFRANGVTHMRIRLWHDPKDENGVKYLAGNCDLDTVLKLSNLAVSKGYKLLLDIHYSDFWADPGKQFVPKAWTGLGLEELEMAVYKYTVSVLRTFKDNGIALDMVQVGNEITNGFMWPVGKLEIDGKRGNYDNFCTLFKAGVKAVREESDAKVVLHLERSHDQEVYEEFLTEMEKHQVDYDVLGASYYPYWHGTFDQFFANMNNCKKFGKEIVVAELGYGFTTESYVTEKGGTRLVIDNDTVSALEMAKRYPLTPQGQAEYVKDFIARAKENAIDGIFYWEPLWIPGKGICWASPEGQKYIGEEGKSTANEWANQCLFDYNGNKLPAFDEYKV